MVTYEVNHDVSKEIEEEYSQWLEAHVREMLGFQGFQSVDWYSRTGDDSDDKVHWCLHYNVRSMADLQDYFDNHVERMKADGARRFGGRYQTSRRILSLKFHFE